MKAAIKAGAWIFFGIDALALVLCIAWALVASTREGEQAYAMVFSAIAALFVAAGGGALALSSRKGWPIGVGCAAFVLALPVLIGLGIWMSNLLGM